MCVVVAMRCDVVMNAKKKQSNWPSKSADRPRVVLDEYNGGRDSVCTKWEMNVGKIERMRFIEEKKKQTGEHLLCVETMV